jgi:hypothetical protein
VRLEQQEAAKQEWDPDLGQETQHAEDACMAAAGLGTFHHSPGFFTSRWDRLRTTQGARGTGAG